MLAHTNQQPVEATSTRAYDTEVQQAIWHAFRVLIPFRVNTHRYGGHRPRTADRLCFGVIMLRLGSGMSWVDACRVAGGHVSDTTVRSRRIEWIAAGIFQRLEGEALAASDRIIVLDLSELAVDGSQHKTPCGGEGTGPNPTGRGGSGHKWSILTEKYGVPIGWVLDSANRHDIRLFEPTLRHVAEHGLHLDKGYDSAGVRDTITDYGITGAVIAKRRKRGESETAPRPANAAGHSLGLRWPVERTNSWLTNFGQLRRNTDRKIQHRESLLA